MRIKKIRGNEAVTEIIGTVLLLVIAIVIFSSLIIYVLSSTDKSPSSPDLHLMGSMDENQHIIIEHRGGETSQLEDLKLLIWKGQEESYTVYFTYSGTPVNEDEEAYTEITFFDLNDNAEWDVGDYIDINCTGLFSEITYWQISVVMIDKPSNSIIMSGILQQGIVERVPPIAIFTYAPLDPKIEEIIEFNASQSYDPDGGTLVIYKWDFDDDGTIDAYGKVVVHQYTSIGTYTVTLTVVDDEGQQGVATTGQGVPGGDIYIPPPLNVTENEVPIVNFSWYVDPDIDGTIHFSADVTDPDGEIASFEWHFGDGNSSSSQNPSHTYSQGGNYTVTLIVYDDDGGYNSTEITITVPNILPIAGFSYTPANVTTASTVNFDGGSPYSFDKDGTIVNWTWDFDNDSIIDAYGATASHLFSTQGVYTIVLNVTDNEGGWNLEIRNITVYSPATAAAPKFLLVDNTPTDSPPGVWESGIDNIIAACEKIMPASDFSYGRAIDQWTFTNDDYTSSDLKGENITETVLNEFDIVIWSTGDFMGDGGNANYDGNSNTWSTPMTEGSDDTSNHVYEIYKHLTGNQTAGTFLMCGAYAVRDLQDYPGNGANDDEIWLGETLGLIEPTGGIEYDSTSVSYSGRCGGGSFNGKPYDASGSLVGIADTSSGQDGIATLNFTSLTLYELYKQSNETFVYSLQAGGELQNVTLLDEDMETNPGWYHTGSGDEWQWGICGGGPMSAHSGSRCYGTDMQGPNYNYNDNADCYVRTGYIDLTDCSSAYLQFYDWYKTENGFDYVYLQVDDGSWHTIASFTGFQTSWTHKSYNISSYVGNNIRIRWRLDTDWGGNYEGYYLDDVWVNATRQSPPPGYYAIDANRETNRSIILGFDLNSDEITNESRENYLRSALSWLAEGAGYFTEIWVNNDPPEGWLDEPDHVATIQGGIDAVTPGGIVYVNGTTGQVYWENVVVDKSITLMGIDNPTIRASGTNVIEVQIDWAKIDGFTIEGNSVQNGIYIENAARCTVINCTIPTNISKMGVYLSYSHNNTIQDNSIHDCLLYGLYASWSFGNKIINNDVYSNAGGIYLHHASLSTVTNNNVYDNGAEWGGIYIESGEQNTMFNNSIFNNTGNGISLYSSANENEMEKNTIQNNSHGVSIEISNSNIILNNTISSNRDSGVYIEVYSHSITVRENTISSNMYGLNIQNSSNNGILLNAFVNNSYGVYLVSSGSNVVQTNDICNNTNEGISLLSSSDNNVISSCTIQNNSHGVYLESSKGNSFQENNISSNTVDGVYLYQSLATFSGENNITNNTISLNSRYGIYLYKSMGNVVSNNSIYLNVQDGIRFYFNTDENSITNNTIWNNSYGIYLYKSSYNVISSNIIHNNSAEGIYLTSYSTENTLYENTIENNTNGMKFESSATNNITTNTIRNNQANGAFLSSASGNAIYSNQIYSNTGDGVYLHSSDDVTITKNTLWSNFNGVHLLLSGGTGNSILNNTIYSNAYHGIYLENSRAATAGNNDIIENEVYSNNKCGLYLYSSNINSLQQNEMYSNNECGIFLNASDSNTLQQNEIYSNDGHGISLYLSDSNDIQSNDISFNQKNGIYILQSSQGDSFPLQNNLIWNNSEAGIYLNASSSNYVTSNTIWNSSYGVVIDESSSSNVVRYSILRNNSYGLYLADSSTTNEIRDNNMTGNDYGAYIATSDCTSNEIYNNNFINNTLHDDSQAYDNGTTNSWHLGEEGNYWSNYRNPYTVPPNGQDNYPLGSPKQWWL